MKSSPTQTKRKPAASPPQPDAAKTGVVPVLLLALIIVIPCVGAWAMWQNIRAGAPAVTGQPTNTVTPPLPNAPAAKDPQGAAQAFAEARRQEKYIIGTWSPTYRMMALAQKAVELDPTKPNYLVYLMQCYISWRKSKEAIATGQQLLALAPEHPWGNVMLANQLLDNGAKPEDYPHIEAMLNIAERDPNLAPATHYGRGLLALRRRNAAVAVSELKQACALDPKSSVGYYNLFLAEKLAGDEPAAARAMAQHDLCVKRNTDALKEHDRLTQTPQSLQGYVQTIRDLEAKASEAEAKGRKKKPRDCRNWQIYDVLKDKKYGAALTNALNRTPTKSTKP